MKTKRKTWYLQKKDILYVEENHDGKYGAKGKERLPKRKLTPEDVQRVNAWNKSKRARLRLMEYFSPGDLWVTFTYKPYGHCQEAVFENDGQAKKDLQEKRQGALLDPEH